ncbi:hypothetical protein G7072_06080 [Nocardioides sp. HDW12B]|uniref:hypothetical protein n=1 Tax=Nocardioides sp. HDW12B TaxID=2714939 RepID=UPI001408045D|nr:hypothetical protein [Nocardioides sp. HDW12B]QIK65961.1 hypothetical protein G7072_06080 [Nocardioides sp. HDW12B]
MTTSLLRRAAAATAGLAAVLSTVAVAAPASAEVFGHTDPARDVTAIDGPRPGVTNGDIRGVRFEHARRNVTLRATFRDLAREGAGLQQYVFVETPVTSYQFLVVAGPGGWRGEFIPFGDDAGCGGTEFKLDYGRDVFTLSLPRGCVGNPQWVKVGLATVTGFAQEGSEQVLVDDALQRGFAFNQETITLSPRLSRAGGSYTG